MGWVGTTMVSISRMTNKFILNAITSMISGFLPSWFTMLNSTGIDYLFYLGIAFATGAAAVAGCKIIDRSRFKKVFIKRIARKIGNRLRDVITRIDYYLYECMSVVGDQNGEKENFGTGGQNRN